MVLIWVRVRVLVLIVRVRIVSAVVRCVHELARVGLRLFLFPDHLSWPDPERQRSPALPSLREAERIDDVSTRRERCLRGRRIRVRLACRQLRGEVIRTVRSATVVRNAEGNGRYS